MYIIGTKTPVHKFTDQPQQFFTQYLVSSQIDRTLMQSITKWLAANCQDNFSVKEIIECTIVGNDSDNQKDVSQGLFWFDHERDASWFDHERDASWFVCHDNLKAYRIGVTRYDDVLFSLVWLDFE